MVHPMRPTWRKLLWIGAFSFSALLIASRLSLVQAHSTLLASLWMALFYGALALWLRRNGRALEHEPPALDPVGRPVIFQDAPLFEAEPEPRPAPLPLTPAPRHQAETM